MIYRPKRQRQDERLVRILVKEKRSTLFSGSTADEPLFNFIEIQIPDVDMYTDIKELPELSTFDDEDKDQEKLVIFDDFTAIPKKV